jgi:hypothetical protein
MLANEFQSVRGERRNIVRSDCHPLSHLSEAGNLRCYLEMITGESERVVRRYIA